MAEPAYSQDEINFAVKQLEAESGNKVVPDQPSEYSQAEIDEASKQLEATPLRETDLGFVERMAATRAKEEPERLEKILADRGFITKRKDNEVLIQQGGKFVPWDPERWDDLGDIADLVPEAFEMAVAMAAGTAKVAGALSLPATGPGGLMVASGLSGGAGALLETGMQGLEKAGGFRKEFDEGQIGAKGLAAATVPGAGAVAKKVIGKFAGKAAPQLSHFTPEEIVSKQVSKQVTQGKEGLKTVFDPFTKKTIIIKDQGAKQAKSITDPFRVRRFKGDKVGKKPAFRVTPKEKLPEISKANKIGSSSPTRGPFPFEKEFKKQAKKELGKKSNDGITLAVGLADAARISGGDLSPIARRLIIAEVKKMGPGKIKRLANFARTKAVAGGKGLGKAVGKAAKPAAQIAAKNEMEALVKSLMDEVDNASN